MMNQMTQWMTMYLINSAWQIPVLALCTAGLLKLTARGGAKLQYRLWVGCLILAIALPAMPRVEMPSFRWHRAEPVSVTKNVDGTAMARASNQIAIYTDAIVAPVEKKSGSRVLLWLYALSLLVGIGKLLGELLATRTVVKGARTVLLTPSAKEAMAQSAEAFGIASVAAYSSADLRSPATVNWPRPMLLVPEDFASFSEEDAAAAISHELAHIRRRDFAANLVFETVSLAVFYHPAMHWMKRRIAESREVLCDEMAAGVTMGRTAYARSLVSLAEGVSVPHAA
jgi:beta-lactamase regulating signal transducer with metallopeptidase domain